jgi:phage terminase small subunit
VRELTTKQQTFLTVLFDEAEGDYTRAKQIAGYSEGTSSSEVIRSLKDEVLELTKEYLAMNAPRAARAMISVLDRPSELGNQHKLSAAKELLDRIGIHKTDKVELTAPSGIMLLPPKDTAHGV